MTLKSRQSSFSSNFNLVRALARSVLRRFNRDNLYLRREDRGSRRSTARRIARVVLVLVARRGVCSPLLASHPCSSRGSASRRARASHAGVLSVSEVSPPVCARARTLALFARKEGPPLRPGRRQAAQNLCRPQQAPRSVGTLRPASFPRYATAAAGWPCTRAAGFGTVPLGPLCHSAVGRRTTAARVGHYAAYK